MADPAQGKYRMIKEEADEYVWAQRTSPVVGNQYDIIWEVTDAKDGGCHVHSKSRSQSLSLMDLNSNFCNMYNVYRSDSRMFDIDTIS